MVAHPRYVSYMQRSVSLACSARVNGSASVKVCAPSSSWQNIMEPNEHEARNGGATCRCLWQWKHACQHTPYTVPNKCSPAGVATVVHEFLLCTKAAFQVLQLIYNLLTSPVQILLLYIFDLAWAVMMIMMTKLAPAHISPAEDCEYEPHILLLSLMTT